LDTAVSEGNQDIWSSVDFAIPLARSWAMMGSNGFQDAEINCWILVKTTVHLSINVKDAIAHGEPIPAGKDNVSAPNHAL
jgi:hypothetical protein